jgi:protease IV
MDAAIGMWNRCKRWVARLFRSEDVFGEIDRPHDRDVQVAMANVVLHDIIRERRQDRAWRLLRRAGGAALFSVGFVYYLSFQLSVHGWRLIPRDPLVGVVRIEGSILNTSIASAEKVVPALKQAFEADNVQAIVLAIDSPGGASVAAERINLVIDDLKARHGKPVYAVIQNVGASAAYMIALHADKIYAGKYSMVGSIGAVLSSWDVHKALARLEVYQKVYASGELKAMLNPFVPSTPAAEGKAQSIVNLMGRRFANELRERRGKLLVATVKYDTGEIWDGEEAKKIGLIDGLATIESVAARYKDAKLYEFGPRSPNGGLFSASVSEWAQIVLSGAIRRAVTAEPKLQ